MDEVLLGENGKRVVQVDVAGQELRNLEAPVAPVAGDNVILTIDTRLQKAAEAALTDEINYWNTILNHTRYLEWCCDRHEPQDGGDPGDGFLADFENNRMARFIPGYYYNQSSRTRAHPLVNNAISAQLPPGSVFKLSTATGAYNEKVITPDRSWIRRQARPLRTIPAHRSLHYGEFARLRRLDL